MRVAITASKGQRLARTTLTEGKVLSCFRRVCAYARANTKGSRPLVCLGTTRSVRTRPGRALMFRSTLRTTRATGGTKFIIVNICSRRGEGGVSGVGRIYSYCYSEVSATVRGVHLAVWEENFIGL